MTLPSLNQSRRRAGLGLALLGACAMVVRSLAAEPLPTPLPEELLPGLSAILNTALTQSPQMVLKNIELIQNEANYVMTRAAQLPSASLGASYSVNGASVASSSDSASHSSGLYYSASISQTLFRWGTVRAQTEAAAIQVSITQRNYVDGYRTLALSLRSQYLGLMVKKMSLRNARYAQQVAANTLKVEEDKLTNGRIPESQIVTFRLSLEESTLQAERAAEDFAQSKRVFMRLAGLKELDDAQIPADIPAFAFAPETSAALLQQFLGHEWENAPTVLNARDSVRVAELNYKNAQYRLYPMLSLGASVTQSNSTNASGGVVSQTSVISQYVGVSMSWAIFDGFATRAAKASAKASIRFYERQLQSTTDQLRDQATAQEHQVGFAYRAMNLAQTRARISASALNVIQEDARSGNAAQAAVDAAQAVNNQYQLLVLSQRADFLSRWTEYISTLGRDPVLAQIPAFSHVR